MEFKPIKFGPQNFRPRQFGLHKFGLMEFGQGTKPRQQALPVRRAAGGKGLRGKGLRLAALATALAFALAVPAEAASQARLNAEAAQAAAQAPPVKPRPIAMDCRQAAATFGAAKVWMGRFAGWRTNIWDDEVMTSQWGCFVREIDCRNWLYWMQTDWSEWTDVASCSPGYRP